MTSTLEALKRERKLQKVGKEVSKHFSLQLWNKLQSNGRGDSQTLCSGANSPLRNFELLTDASFDWRKKKKQNTKKPHGLCEDKDGADVILSTPPASTPCWNSKAWSGIATCSVLVSQWVTSWMSSINQTHAGLVSPPFH